MLLKLVLLLLVVVLGASGQKKFAKLDLVGDPGFGNKTKAQYNTTKDCLEPNCQPPKAPEEVTSTISTIADSDDIGATMGTTGTTSETSGTSETDINTTTSPEEEERKSKVVKKDRIEEEDPTPPSIPTTDHSRVIGRKGVSTTTIPPPLDADPNLKSVPKKGVSTTTIPPPLDADPSLKSVPKKGVEMTPSTGVIDQSVEDNLNQVPMGPGTISAEIPDPQVIESTKSADPATPNTSLLVGLVFGLILFGILGFLVFKRVNALRKRRRDYSRMNDFLIDGMYSDM